MEKLFACQIEFTNACNCRCKQCPQSVRGQHRDGCNPYDRPIGYLSLDLLQLFRREANRYARSVIIGYFGEPMLHPQFREFVDALAHRRRFGLTINSNWSRATLGDFETFRQFSRVKIAMDASTPALYDLLRPGDGYLDMWGRPTGSRYEALVEKIHHWLSEPHSATSLVYAVSSRNEHDVQPFLDAWLPQLPSQDEILVKSIVSYGGVMNDPHMTPWSCDMNTSRRLTVAWDGRVTPCNLDVNCALQVGNLYQTPDFRKILNCPVYLDTMAAIAERRGKICLRCPDANNRRDDVRHAGRKKVGT